MKARVIVLIAGGTAAAAIAIAVAFPASTPRSRAQEIVHERDGSVMIVVPAGEFTMGCAEGHPDLPESPPGAEPLRPRQVLLARADPAWRAGDERPVRQIRMTAFAIDRHEVTNAQYRRFVDWIAETGDHRHCHPDEPAGKDHRPRYWGEFNPLLRDEAYAATTPFDRNTFTAADRPLVGVDWYDAYAYAAWVGKRLPTEAEWEYAARGTDARRWPWGSEWAWGRANTGGEKHGRDTPGRREEKDGYVYPAPVGSYPEGRSPFGCDDMAGNVAEWCNDWYRMDYYRSDVAADPPGPESGRRRVVRGGSSRNAPSSVRCAKRAAREPLFRTFTLGFRCAKDL